MSTDSRDRTDIAEARRTPQHTGLILVIVLVSYFMIVLNNSIVFTGLEQIQREMGLGSTALSWVQNAYTLVFGGLLLLGARAGDLLGRRRMFIIGLALFGVASLLVGLAPDGGLLIAARALQGIGAAIVAPSSLALITANFAPGAARNRAVAAYGTTAGIGASLGLVVGGALSALLSWRAGFFVSVPIAAAMIVLAVIFLPASVTVRGRFDLVGAVTSTLGMGALIYGIVNAAEQGWTAPITIVALAVGVIVLVGFVVNEWRAPQPILPLRIFRSAERSSAAIARLLFAGAIIGLYFFTTQLVQGTYGWTPLGAGLAFLPMTVSQFVFSLFIPRLVRRIGNGPLVLVGLLLTVAGMIWLTALTPGESYLAGLVGPLILLGVGQGLSFGPLTAVGISGAAAEDAGAASGLVNTAHQLGSTLGVAVLTVAGVGASTLIGRVVDSYVAAALMLVGAVIAMVIGLAIPAYRARRVLRSA